MKTFISLLLTLISSVAALAQEFTRSVHSFTQVIVSPHINVVLKKGNEESVTFKYANVDKHRINVEVTNRKLHLYLDKARITEDDDLGFNTYDDYDFGYANAEVTAIITYRNLESLQVRGKEEVEVKGTLDEKDFHLVAYGASYITIDTLNARHFKARLYGNNRLRIHAGEIDMQKYRLYGDNKVDARDAKGHQVSTVVYGDGSVHVNADDELSLSAFGDPEIRLEGPAHVTTGIVLGNPTIRD